MKGHKRGWKIVITDLVVPGIGALADVWLLLSLDTNAKELGAIWLVLGIAYLAYLTKFFRVPPPEIAI
jgi:hypothetical protein